MLKVKALIPVRHGGLRHEIGTKLEIKREDYNEKYFELIEELEEEPKGLKDMNVTDLKELAKKYEIEGYSNLKKDELIEALSNLED